jgi:hypothetical protein
MPFKQTGAFYLSDNSIFHAPNRRAEHYREQAALFRRLAEADQTPSFREGLFKAAAQYERLAAEVSAG